MAQLFGFPNQQQDPNALPEAAADQIPPYDPTDPRFRTSPFVYTRPTRTMVDDPMHPAVFSHPEGVTDPAFPHDARDKYNAWVSSYQQKLQQMPTIQDFKPSIKRRIAAAGIGIISGGTKGAGIRGEGYDPQLSREAAASFLYSPYTRAMATWQSQTGAAEKGGKALEESAKMEHEEAIEQARLQMSEAQARRSEAYYRRAAMAGLKIEVTPDPASPTGHFYAVPDPESGGLRKTNVPAPPPKEAAMNQAEAEWIAATEPDTPRGQAARTMVDQHRAFLMSLEHTRAGTKPPPEVPIQHANRELYQGQLSGAQHDISEAQQAINEADRAVRDPLTPPEDQAAIQARRKQAQARMAAAQAQADEAARKLREMEALPMPGRGAAAPAKPAAKSKRTLAY